MKLIASILGGVLLAAVLGVTSAAAIALAMPDYTVEFSAVSGKCKKVEYRGQIVSDGCKLVAAGGISRYEVINGY